VDGTSVAAPIVSSIAVQMVGANPRLAPGAIKAIIADTAVPMRDVPPQKQGHGLVNPAGAVAAALRAPGGPLVNYPLSPHRRPDGSIQFIYYNPRHERVALVGDFNGWFAAESAFTRVAPGLFQYTLPHLPSGIYRYKFLLDDRTAVDDPENLDKAPDGAGGFSSRLWVP
jgi:serine protease AprX